MRIPTKSARRKSAFPESHFYRAGMPFHSHDSAAVLTERLDRHRGAGQQHIKSSTSLSIRTMPSSETSTRRRGCPHRPKSRDNPMLLDMQSSPRGGAKTRKGSPCQSPAMPNGRCRMHGGLSPGAPKGNRNAWKHGLYSAEHLAVRRMLAAARGFLSKG